jgi:PRTRC genetic system protein B
MSDNGQNDCTQTPVVGELLPGQPINLAHPAVLQVLDDCGTQEMLMRLDIFSESIFRTIYEGGQPVAYDEISPLALAQALAGVEATTGILPHDTIFCHYSGHEYYLAIYLPPERHSLHLDGEEQSLEIPLPPLVFVGRALTYRVFALADDGWPGERTPLYRAPFPNVFPDGLICAGSVRFPGCHPNTIHQAAALFLESHFNRDLAGGKSQTHPKGVIALWQELVEKSADVYPLEDLVPVGIALGELLKT